MIPSELSVSVSFELHSQAVYHTSHCICDGMVVRSTSNFAREVLACKWIPYNDTHAAKARNVNVGGIVDGGRCRVGRGKIDANDNMLTVFPHVVAFAGRRFCW